MPVSPAPVSPNSDTLGNPTALDTRIITGGGSLNSTLSAGENGKEELHRVLIDTNLAIKEEEKEQKGIEADKITDDIFAKLMDELKGDLDVMLLNDPRLT